MKRYWQSFIDLLFPKACAGCNRPLLREESFLCTHCELELPINPEINQQKNEVKEVFSGRLPLLWANSFLHFSKNGITQNLIHALKYQDREDLGFELGLRFGIHIKSILPEKPDLIIPMPLHPKKQQLRGYNQCQSIAAGLAQALETKVENEAMSRTVANRSQTQLNRANRWKNVQGIFSLDKPDSVAQKHIMLIDDTLTTGATLESCGIELLTADGVKLSIATLAYAK